MDVLLRVYIWNVYEGRGAFLAQICAPKRFDCRHMKTLQVWLQRVPSPAALHWIHRPTDIHSARLFPIPVLCVAENYSDIWSLLDWL